MGREVFEMILKADHDRYVVDIDLEIIVQRNKFCEAAILKAKKDTTLSYILYVHSIIRNLNKDSVRITQN